jgi:uncharacterized protein (UPF0335 family)
MSDETTVRIGNVESWIERTEILEKEKSALLLRVAELEQQMNDAHDKERCDSEHISGLTHDVNVMHEQLDAAKADAARLREAFRARESAYDAIESGAVGTEKNSLQYARYSKTCMALDEALGADDSTAWLESKIAERTALHVEREKSLTAQLAAATNDAALAELRAQDLRTALTELVPLPNIVGQGVERGLACGRSYLAVNGCIVAMEGDDCREIGIGSRWTGKDFDKIEAKFKAPILKALAANPDSDERLREVIQRALVVGDLYLAWPPTKEALVEFTQKVLDGYGRADLDEVLRGAP